MALSSFIYFSLPKRQMIERRMSYRNAAGEKMDKKSRAKVQVEMTERKGLAEIQVEMTPRERILLKYTLK